MRYVALLLAIAACDEERALDAPGVQDGAVLHARGYNFLGGGVFRTWFDTALGFECSFRPAIDGELRCLPDDAPATTYGYLDAGCTQPAIVVPTCAKTGMFATHAPRAIDTCAGAFGTSVYLREAASTDTTFFYDTGIDCMQAATLPDEVVVPLGGEVAATAFVSAQPGIQIDIGARLSPYALIIADGSREPISIWDADHAAECFPDDERRCVPVHTAFTQPTLWAEATCSTDAAAISASARQCQPPTAVAVAGPVRQYWELGDPLATAYWSAGAACEPSVQGSFYGVGAPIELASFESAVAVRAGTGRVQIERFAATDGRALYPGDAMFDTELGAPCRPIKLVDGTTRCAPDVVVWSDEFTGTFADAACTEPLTRGNDRAVVIRNDPASTRCDPRHSVYEIGEAYDGPIYRLERATGACNLEPLDEPYFRFGAEVTNLPALEVRD